MSLLMTNIRPRRLGLGSFRGEEITSLTRRKGKQERRHKDKQNPKWTKVTKKPRKCVLDSCFVHERLRLWRRIHHLELLKDLCCFVSLYIARDMRSRVIASVRYAVEELFASSSTA